MRKLNSMWKLSGATRLTRSVLAFSMAGVCALGLFLLVPVAAQPAGDPVIYLDQGWSQADRELFYQTPQGSSIASYDIFMNMEVAGSQELFRSDANSARFGLIPQAANPRTNPDGFPVGVTKNVVTEGRWKGDTVGPNCAVCHTAQLMYKGKQIRIDGGHTNLFDIQAYMQALDQAFQATLSDTAKFDRMAARAGATSADAKSDLRKRFASQAERTHYYSTVAAASPSPWGPGRADCLTLIVNRLLSIEPNIPQNMSVAAAPVKIPFVWNAGQATWTQWGGWAQDPLTRNYGETLGVYLPMDLQSKTPEEGLFDSAAALLNLQKIEDTMWRLAPPKWPEEIFGKIDRQKAATGQGAVCQQLRELPQHLAVHVDRGEQVRHTLPRSWTRAQDIHGYRHAADGSREPVHAHESVEPLFGRRPTRARQSY